MIPSTLPAEVEPVTERKASVPSSPRNIGFEAMPAHCEYSVPIELPR